MRQLDTVSISEVSMQAEPHFSIGARKLGHNDPTYFIADIGANHDGSLERAKRLIFLAAEAGSDAVKFQHFRADHIVSDRGFLDLGAQTAHQAAWDKPVYEVYREASLPWTWTEQLWRTAQDCGVEFMSTPYDLEAVNHLEPFVNAYKIGSGDVNWFELLEAVGVTRKPVILATGASSLEEVEAAVSLLDSSTLAVLQCNTNYTGDESNIDHVNLRSLATFQHRFPSVLPGLSDHTKSESVAVGAVALGARIIERHFTDDDSRSGPDHNFALTPGEWARMVAAVRELERSLGNGAKVVMPNEVDSRIVQRRCIRAGADISEGSIIERAHLAVLRPAPDGSIPPSLLDDVVGRVASRDLQSGEHLTWADLRSS